MSGAAVTPTDETRLARMREFNETTGVFGYMTARGPTGANHHPDRCVCQGNPNSDDLDYGEQVRAGSCGPNGDTTPHKHRADGSCARCLECQQYVPMIPTMRFGECDICPRGGTFGNGVPVGIDCMCGRHFHIGDQMLAGDSIACPTCERSVHPVLVAKSFVEEEAERPSPVSLSA